MDIADGEGDTADAHYHFAVTADAHDVAFHSFEVASGYTLLGMALGIIAQWLGQKLDAVGDGVKQVHKNFHIILAHRLASILIK